MPARNSGGKKRARGWTLLSCVSHSQDFARPFLPEKLLFTGTLDGLNERGTNRSVRFPLPLWKRTEHQNLVWVKIWLQMAFEESRLFQNDTGSSVSCEAESKSVWKRTHNIQKTTLPQQQQQQQKNQQQLFCFEYGWIFLYPSFQSCLARWLFWLILFIYFFCVCVHRIWYILSSSRKVIR